MNKGELVDALAQKIRLSKKDAHACVEAIFGQNGGIIATILRKGNSFHLAGFGTFEIKKRKARTARNPKTGKPVQIPSTKVPTFKPAKGLKERVNP